MTKPMLQPSYVAGAQEGRGSMGDWAASLIEAALAGDQAVIRRAGSLFAQEYQGPDRREVHGRISVALRNKTTPLDQVRSVDRLPVDGKSRAPLLEAQEWPTLPLVLEEEHEMLLSRFVREAANAEKLAAAGLGSRFNMLLSGPPGTGKSFIASHIAARLGLPFHVVRLDTVVSSLLGDTAKNIRALFEFAAHGPGFLFLDEIDAIAKRRDDARELGEIKRVVNTLIQGLDMLHERTVIVAATNHAHLLDPAIFRRFPYHLDVGLPGPELREGLWALYLFNDQEEDAASLLSQISDGLSCSDIRELSIAARRTALLNDEPVDLTGLAWAVTRSQAGRLQMPPTSCLVGEIKSDLQGVLHEKYGLKFEHVGRLAGVTRQSATTTARRAAKRAGKAIANG